MIGLEKNSFVTSCQASDLLSCIVFENVLLTLVLPNSCPRPEHYSWWAFQHRSKRAIENFAKAALEETRRHLLNLFTFDFIWVSVALRTYCLPQAHRSWHIRQCAPWNSTFINANLDIIVLPSAYAKSHIILCKALLWFDITSNPAQFHIDIPQLDVLKQQVGQSRLPVQAWVLHRAWVRVSYCWWCLGCVKRAWVWLDYCWCWWFFFGFRSMLDFEGSLLTVFRVPKRAWVRIDFSWGFFGFFSVLGFE